MRPMIALIPLRWIDSGLSPHLQIFFYKLPFNTWHTSHACPAGITAGDDWDHFDFTWIRLSHSLALAARLALPLPLSFAVVTRNLVIPFLAA